MLAKMFKNKKYTQLLTAVDLFFFIKHFIKIKIPTPDFVNFN